jgi:hypothetical protein
MWFTLLICFLIVCTDYQEPWFALILALILDCFQLKGLRILFLTMYILFALFSVFAWAQRLL